MSAGRDMRVSATTYDLEDLVSEAWAGRIRVPHFQRDFRWTLHDVRRLFDSIVKGYPIGSLLLWVRPAEAQTIRLGALEIPAPETEQALWVVDGQQRITSLANALHEKGGIDPRFALSYDLSDEMFVRRSTQPDPSLIPLPVLFDLDRLLQWFANNREISDQLQKATSVAKTLHQFKIPAYQVKQDDVAVLQDIFDRMNNYGKRLSKAEVFSALYAGKEVAKDERLSFALIAEHIDEDLHFGRIDDDTVLRAILARRGPDVEREIRIEFNEKERRGTVDFPGEDLETAYESGEQALRRAVRFLQETAGVPHVTFLAYQYLLIVLSRLFAHHPEPDARNLQLLRRWFWRAALVGPALFKGSTTGTTRALCSKILPDDLTGSVQELLAAVGHNAFLPPDSTRFKTNYAATKITLCAWWSLEPRSPNTGEPYELSQLSEILTDSATAAEAVPNIFSRRAVPERYRMWAANRILRPDKDETANEVDSLLSPQHLAVAHERTWEAILRSHAITPDTARLLTPDKIEEFLEARQETVRTDLNDFLEGMCEWEFEDTPPLTRFVVDDIEGDEDNDAA
ncbi:MAG: DUF262 domain-containing protein [Egibacteraceae bacterium]